MHNKPKTKDRSPTNNGRYKKQCIDNNRATTLERTAVKAARGLNAFKWRLSFALDYVVEKTELN